MRNSDAVLPSFDRNLVLHSHYKFLFVCTIRLKNITPYGLPHMTAVVVCTWIENVCVYPSVSLSTVVNEHDCNSNLEHFTARDRKPKRSDGQ